MHTPTYYVLVPDDRTAAGITYARRYFVRQARPQTGVWAIENSAGQPGYHLNVIADKATLTGKFKGRIYAEPIRTNIRAVAAYITKAERAASKEQGFDRQTGNLGHAKTWLATPGHHMAIVNAAQMAHEIDQHYLPPSAPGPERSIDTARRWLAVIYEELRKHNEAQNNLNER